MTDVNESTQAAAPAETQTQAATANGGTGPELNLSDLGAIKSIIDVASQRGAFKANELESVGKIYNRLSAFLDSVAKKDQ
jgi:hypothetical protein